MEEGNRKGSWRFAGYCSPTNPRRYSEPLPSWEPLNPPTSLIFALDLGTFSCLFHFRFYPETFASNRLGSHLIQEPSQRASHFRSKPSLRSSYIHSESSCMPISRTKAHSRTENVRIRPWHSFPDFDQFHFFVKFLEFLTWDFHPTHIFHTLDPLNSYFIHILKNY